MNKILISDVSLKSFNGHENLQLSFKEKLEIAKRLNDLCVDFIEIGPCTNSKTDEVLVKTLCACINKSTISCVCENSVNGVEKAYSLISLAKKKRLLLEIPVSPIQMEYSVSKKPKAVLELIDNLTKKAVSLCDDVEVAFDDATRAESDFLCSAIKTAIDDGAKTISVVDLAGAMLPGEFNEFIIKLYDNVPELKNVTLSVQVSDVMSMATASAFSAIMAGAKVIKLSALKNNSCPSVETFVSALDTIGSKKGFSCGLNKTAISRIVNQISIVSSSNKESNVFDATIDNSSDVIPDNVTSNGLKKIIKKLGYDLSEQDNKKVYTEFTRMQAKKQVSIKELDVIIANNALQVPETYSLSRFSVNSSNVMNATASIVLTKDNKELSGLSFGNGSVDAAFLALENIIGRHFELDGFELGAVTEGKEAMGQALVKLRNGGKLYSGRGVSTDIVGASIRAYVNAVNKIVYEENEL